MDAHMKCAHSTKKTVYKYMCAKCGKGNDNKAHYQIHADRHSDMKYYSCGKCDYCCYSTSQLNLHVTSCIDGISHECSICGKEFLQKQYLKNHFKNEHLIDNNKILFCNICIRLYKYENSYKRHMAKEHKFKPST